MAALEEHRNTHRHITTQKTRKKFRGSAMRLL
jgi:hypothetical protein